MATVHFSVPDDIKNRFNQIFAHHNKSQIISKLMEQAIEEHERQQRRLHAIDALLKIRATQKPVSHKAVQSARRRNIIGKR